MSDEDYFVRNAVEPLASDVDSDERYELLTDREKAAALLWILDQRVRIDGIGGWIETHGQRSDDALAALHAAGATKHAAEFQVAISLVPTRTADDPDTRLSGMDQWSEEDATTWRNAEGRLLALIKADDLLDNYVRPLVAAHPEDFPMTVDDL